MDRFELLAMSSCVPFKANKQYEYKYHFVCPFHVVAPYLFKSYFPGIYYVLNSRTRFFLSVVAVCNGG